jgi:hypothetical protein
MRNWLATCMSLLGLALLLPTAAPAQQVVRNGFEGLKTAWDKASSDAPFDEIKHALTDLASHDGKQSEYLQLDVKQGNFIYYQYPVGKAPVGDELTAGVWIKADRPGVQLLARLVLPNQRDPKNLANVLTTFLRGDVYQQAGQWKRLALSRPVQLMKNQKTLMQAQENAQLDFTGAYIDNLLLNVYAGPGPTQVWIDDLEIGPVVGGVVATPATRPSGPPTPGTLTNIPRPKVNASLAVELRNNQIVVNQNRILIHGIRYTDTALKPLRDAGFNTLLVDGNVSEPILREAAEMDFWVAPQLSLLADNGQPRSPDEVRSQLNRFGGNSVLFVRFGGMLTFEQANLVNKATQVLREVEPNRLVAGDVWDGLQPFSRSLDLVGIHRWPLMTSMELPQYREWLELRRKLANPDVFTWTWIQTHLTEAMSQLLYDHPTSTGFTEPVGPQPEQIRLLTYTALAAGCRGLAFYSDRFLADSHQGRDRLLSCALLNQEMEMLEPLLADASTTEWIDTSVPDIKAAVIRCAHGVLVLPMWQGTFAQCVPGQAASSKLSITVPQVPASTQVFEISPAEVKHLQPQRIHTGMKVTLREFGLTAALLFTSDMELIARYQDKTRVRRQQAAQWSYDLAEYELQKVVRVQEQLEKMGRSVPDTQQRLDDAKKRLKSAKEMWDNRLFAEAYHEAQRVLRPLRVVMREQWEKAARGLDSPVTNPYAVSYYTLPRFWQLKDYIRTSVAADNLLPSGDFEDSPERKQETWQVPDLPPLDEVDVTAQRVGRLKPPEEAKTDAKLKLSPYVFAAAPHGGKRCVMLQIRPKGEKAAPQALDRTQILVHSPPVRLQPGTPVQITAWMCIPSKIQASPDGALFYDSAGGEEMAIRLREAMGWKKLTLYRRVPANGVIQVTLALTGLGTVLFDDIAIEQLLPESTPAGQQARALRDTREREAKERAEREARELEAEKKASAK